MFRFYKCAATKYVLWDCCHKCSEVIKTLSWCQIPCLSIYQKFWSLLKKLWPKNMDVVYFNMVENDMVKNDKKHLEMTKKGPFSSCAWEAYEEKRWKKFVGQRMGVTPKSWSTPNAGVAHLEFCCFCTFFYMSNACELYKFFSSFFFVSLSCALCAQYEKGTFFTIFECFLLF